MGTEIEELKLAYAMANLIENKMTDTHWNHYSRVFSQLAGRRPQRSHPEVVLAEDVPLHFKHRGAFRDLADKRATRKVVAGWIREDAENLEGGSVFGAIGDAFHRAHRVIGKWVKRGVNTARSGFRKLHDAYHHVESMGRHVWDGVHRAAAAGKANAALYFDKKSHELLGTKLRHKYLHYHKAGYKKEWADYAKLAVEANKMKDARKDVAGWDYLQMYSNDIAAAYRNKKTGELHVSYRGTSPDSVKRLASGDLATDMGVAIGNLSFNRDRQKVAKDTWRKLSHENPDAKKTIGSYSMGSAHAAQIFNDEELNNSVDKYIDFGVATSPLLDNSKYLRSDKVQHITGIGDPVSASGMQYANERNWYVMADTLTGKTDNYHWLKHYTEPGTEVAKGGWLHNGIVHIGYHPKQRKRPPADVLDYHTLVRFMFPGISRNGVKIKV